MSTRIPGRFPAMLAFGLLLQAPPTAWAGDGLLEINQTCAVQTGCLPNDTPGFPVTIDAKGSYLLTSNLVVTSTTPSAIRVLADDVEIDLNGFSLRGPVTCTGAGAEISCTTTNVNADGIRANDALTGTTVRNGTIRGFYNGIDLNNECTVERVISTSNNLHGLVSNRHCRIIHNVSFRNGGIGINTDRGNTIFGNVAIENGGIGIRMGGTASVLRSNVSAENGGTGVLCFRNCVVERNSIYLNGLDGLTSTGGGSIVNGNLVALNAQDQMVLSDSAGFVNNLIREGATAGGRVTGGVYMPENVCQGVTGATPCETVP